MSYNSYKGYKGEKEVAEFLTNTFKEFGYKFVRVGGTERNKKFLAGDVVLDYNTDPDNICVLRPYFIEVKKHSKPEVFSFATKAKDDAKSWNKLGYILFIIKSPKGEYTKPQKIVVMEWDTFGQIIKDLQWYANKYQQPSKSE